MPQLETVEDFERVDKALDDSSNNLADYAVVSYGYCEFCKSLSAFDETTEPYHVICQGCGKDFWPDHMGLSFLCCVLEKDRRHMYEFLRSTSEEPKSEAEKKFFSRKYQRKLFGERLENKIMNLKSRQRALGSQIRRLAKLR